MNICCPNFKSQKQAKKIGGSRRQKECRNERARRLAAVKSASIRFQHESSTITNSFTDDIRVKFNDVILFYLLYYVELKLKCF